jgi:hypothetical protein
MMDKKLRTPPILTCLLSFAAVTSAIADPPDYRANSIDPRVGQVPAEIQAGIFREPEKHIGPLVKFLTAGKRSDFEKVKVIHDWIADNIEYDVESYFSDARTESSGDRTLVRRRAVCEGYASLMKQMCELVGIPCEDISGFGRGYGSSTGRSRDTSEENHAWNAVNIEGRWYLVDVTWDAGHVDERKYEKHYRTTYLFMEPHNFVFTHFPKDPQWQLLRRPLTAEQFKRLPHLRGTFFDHGLRLATRLSRVTRAGASVQFTIRLTREVELMGRMLKTNGEELPLRTHVQWEDGQCRVYAVFPQAGRYRVNLYCRPLGETRLMKQAADLDFEATSGSSKTFPKTYASYDRLRGYLLSPLYVPLATGEPLTFKVRLQGAHDVSLAIGNKPWLRLAPSPGQRNVYELKTPIPAGADVRLNAKLSPDADSYKKLIEFTGGGG